MSLMYAVSALREIADQLGRKNHKFNYIELNLTNWDTTRKPEYANYVFYNCSFPGDICRVQAMYVFDLLSVSALFRFKSH